jgi:acetyltransferase
MSLHNLDQIFKPQRIALICLGAKPSPLALSTLHNLLDCGFPGVVYPVNPDIESFQGIPTYTDVAHLPRTPDLALICAPAGEVPSIVEDCGRAGIGGIVIMSGGFRESGEEGRLLERTISGIVRRFPGMRIIGPNSLGLIVPNRNLNASHAVTMPKAGRLAFVSESRALCNSVIDWAAEEGIGFSAFVSIGTMLDVGFGDLIDYFGSDPDTRAIILYLQSIEHPRKFMSAARAFARSKPIVAYKAGRYAESAQAAASHTGAMVAEDAVYEAAFKRAGVVRVTELDDVFDVAELLASQRLPRGARLGIITNAGGPAIIATDALLARRGSLAMLSDETLAGLDTVLPPVWSRANPVDLLDSAPPERYANATSLVLEDANVDAALVIFATQTNSDPQRIAEVVVEAARSSHKPILAAWMGGGRVRNGIRVLNEASIPTHTTPEQAVRAFMHLVTYSNNLESLYETPRDIPVHFNLNRRKLRKKLRPLLEEGAGGLTELQAWAFLRAYQIPVCKSSIARSTDEAVKVAGRIGYPVALKVLSPKILHKVDMGGVALDLQRPDEVRAAYKRMRSSAGGTLSEDDFKGVTVQKMMHFSDSLELILGAKKDATFGPVIMIGIGGIATGVVQDRALGLPPLNERLVRTMLESLRFWPVLEGYRGQPAIDLDQLIEVIIRFSLLVTDYPEIREFDINPLLATPERVLALGAAMILDDTVDTSRLRPYSHLAIRPYPEEYVRSGSLRDGTSVTFRSIRPEDEPLWHELIETSSPESIRFRFRSLFRQATHQMAVEHCMIDYEREIAIVAETRDAEQRQLCGAAQLMADADHEAAEFAVLVPDPWQGRGVGGMLLDYSLRLARRWGIQRVVAETDPDNRRMLAVFEKRGFTAHMDRNQDSVCVYKSLIEKALTPREPVAELSAAAAVEGDAPAHVSGTRTR